ncbi:MAG: phosphoenolpyruvate synthase [Alphaproteobacteria bacterium]|nr:phosphoenolpyruvate synthase [Alphaproteobacteria bacterium]
MSTFVLDLRDLDRSAVALVGGKAANLGELARLEGVSVPEGFCVTTDALAHPLLPTEALAELAARVGQSAWAVRSSATAEDAPGTSFAGQHDSWLDVVGVDAIVAHVSRCRASLFTDRAVAYRAANGLDPRQARMAVVVQRMVPAEVSGVLFTADPVSGHRRTTVIEAVRGLGDALVAGRVSPEVVRVRDGRVVERTGGLLSDADALRLEALGRRIEAHFGRPQDIEWCLAGGELSVVQARPITTLFPVPEMATPGPHVFLSVGHNQMMTDAMKPLGLSVWRMTTPRPMFVAGGRLFVEVSKELASPVVRPGFLAMLERADPLTGKALAAVEDLPEGVETPRPPPGSGPPVPIPTDPALVTALIEETHASLEALEAELGTRSGVDLLDVVQQDLGELQRLMRKSHQAAMAGMEATWWLDDHLGAWLGESKVADTLTLAAPGNVTSEMGLDLLRLADVIRPHADAVATLERARDASFVEELPPRVRDAFLAYLETYGARCTGEIDLTRPRWFEEPTALLPTLLHHVRNAAPGEAERRVERGRRLATAKEAEVLERLRGLEDGEAKVAETRRMIERLRTFIGFREFPKYGMIRRYGAYKRALLREAERLGREGVLREPDDVSFLTWEELRDVVASGVVDRELVDARRARHVVDQRLTPPRVLTSDGEVRTGTYDRTDVEDGALVGLPVSAGVVEGRARVVLDLADAALEPGDILVTRFTDPGWTPVFLGIAGLVTEVGGQMTHGSVIARELGLPAVVAVEHATRLIRDGQRIRVDGTRGTVSYVD